MITKNIIEGLCILEKYRDNIDGYDTGADHDVIYSYATDKPVEEADLNRLVELGWTQEYGIYDDSDSCEEFTAKNYNPDESWTINV